MRKFSAFMFWLLAVQCSVYAVLLDVSKAPGQTAEEVQFLAKHALFYASFGLIGCFAFWCAARGLSRVFILVPLLAALTAFGQLMLNWPGVSS